MKKRVFNLIILDESGSMWSIKKQAVDGVNETIQTIRNAQQQHPEQDHFISFISFNTARINTIYDRTDASCAEEITMDQYQPSCGTPLYDAMGSAITALRSSVADNDVVLVTVITDGEENSSREFSGASIKSLVESLKNRGWVFTYIGANQDVEKVAATMSINNSLSFSADVEGTKCMFARESRARERFFNRLNEEPDCFCNSDYFADDEDPTTV
ncbi:MAG: VWA domain-containing protein [Clostridium sp.]|nr:VWA domain-containing protein [Clostridium sp.]